jgi:hypothetical protein
MIPKSRPEVVLKSGFVPERQREGRPQRVEGDGSGPLSLTYWCRSHRLFLQRGEPGRRGAARVTGGEGTAMNVLAQRA